MTPLPWTTAALALAFEDRAVVVPTRLWARAPRSELAAVSAEHLVLRSGIRHGVPSHFLGEAWRFSDVWRRPSHHDPLATARRSTVTDPREISNIRRSECLISQ